MDTTKIYTELLSDLKAGKADVRLTELPYAAAVSGSERAAREGSLDRATKHARGDRMALRYATKSDPDEASTAQVGVTHEQATELLRNGARWVGPEELQPA